MKIIFLGWGSLVWDPRDLPHHAPWESSGPELPIEFSRVSSDCRLTLVVDLSASKVPARFVLSSRSNISDSVEDLRRREGTTRRNIGFCVVASGANSRTEFSRQVDITDIVRPWCADRQIDACVWTALLPNFQEELGHDFSPDQGIAYLAGLSKSARENALKYIRNAPAEVDTPLRRLVSAHWPSGA